MNHFRLFILYVMATQDGAAVQAFDEALRRHGRKQGIVMMYFPRRPGS